MSETAESPIVTDPRALAARRQDERTRVRMGAADDAAPEVLAALANDDSVLVRSAVALNQATPEDANLSLTGDPDERVRMVLARKLSALLPSLSSDEQASLARRAWENLAVLARDEAERVRGLVADLIKDLPNVPHDLILHLAHDASFMVSDPVIRLSPVLTQEDLLTLLSAPPHPYTAQSVARRPALDAILSDAVVASADTDAIRSLLKNRSAAIREVTLDRLVEQAAEQTDWHEPLVQRPVLSARSIKLLAGFVSERLIGILAARPDLEPTALAPLRAQLERRLSQPIAPPNPPQGANWSDPPKAAGAGNWRSETALIDAIRLGETTRVTMMIAAAAGVTMEQVRHGARLRSAKAAVSLLWKGGFSMRPAAAVQALLFNLTPEGMLRADEDGLYPLSEEEMTFQIAFLTQATTA